MRYISKIALALLLLLPSIAAAAPYLPAVGGTGTSTPPTYGKLLMGNNLGIYQLTSTSSLFQNASASTNGILTSTDWATFNGKQAAGNYITALTGDGTASGPGSVGFTLATVNSNTGSFGGSTAIPVITANGKGLITALSTVAVIAPAGTLSGATLNATVVNSSLTSVGTLSTLTVSGNTTLANASSTNEFSGRMTALTAAFGATASTTIASNGTLTTPALTIASLSGVLKASSGVVSTASNGTDYTLITAKDCTGTGHVLSVTAAGVFTCSADSGGGGGSGSVGTSTVEAANRIGVFTTNGATPALLGSYSTLTFDSTTGRFATTYASTTGQSSTYASSTNAFFGTLSIGTLSGLVGANNGATYAVSTTSMNASITGSAGSVANALTINNGGAGVASGGTFNGSSAVTLSYNSIGAVPTTRNINTTFPLQGGGALSGDLTLTNAFGTTTNTGLTVNQVLYTSNSGVIITAATSSVSNGAGISLSGSAAVLGAGGLTITNTGVTSLAGTANQITASAATGAVTLSLPTSLVFTNATSSNEFSGRMTANTAAFGQTGSTTISSTGALSTPSATIGSLSGLLLGTAGAVSAYSGTGACPASQAITALSSVGGSTCGTFSTFAYPFNVATNATSTKVEFNGGLTSYASTTVGNGIAGLTVSGNSTTTGSASILGQLSVGTTTQGYFPTTDALVLYNTNTSGNVPSILLAGNIAGDTDFRIGRTNQNDTADNDSLTITRTGANYVSASIPIATFDYTGRMGVGTSSPFAKLSVHANPTDNTFSNTLFAISSSTASATTTLFSIDNIGQMNMLIANGTSTIMDIFRTPAFTIFTGSTTGSQFTVAATTSSPTNIIKLFDIDQYGHQIASSTGATPALSSCGTGPAASAGANDVAGIITTGSGATACTVTFASPYNVAPVVMINAASNSVYGGVTAVSTTAFTVTFSGGFASSKFSYTVVQP